MANSRRRNTRPTARGRRVSSYDEERQRQRAVGRRFDSTRRLAGVFIVLIALFCVVLGRLVYLQVIHAKDLRADADLYQANTITISARRGTIYDRNGNVLAISEECTTIYCDPSSVEDVEQVASILAEYLGGDASDYEAILDQEDVTYAYIYRQADTEVAEALQAELEEEGLTGIYYIEDYRRHYPYGSVANQLLGYVGVDGDGITGLEYQYDDILGGTDGTLILEMGADGTPVAGSSYEYTEAVNGEDIIISIDIELQAKVEEIIVEATETYGADSGTVVVTNPQTGEILAACSTPLVDFSDASTITDESLQLKAVSYAYEVGSAFKPITFSIGLEIGAYTEGTIFTVPSEIAVGDDTVTDDDGRNYTMSMDIREILRRSSNVGTVLVANAIGAEAFAAGIANFGIGSLTGIDFPGETAGLVTQLADYTGASLGAMSFGQSLAVPAISLVQAIGTIANSGVQMTPHFLVSRNGVSEDWGEGEQIISAETASIMTDLMRTVVEEGTATAAQVDGYDIVGKTGTAQIADETTGGYIDGSYLASMIGYVNPDDPEVLVYVGLNGTSLHAADSAAAVFSTIMSEAITIFGISASS